MNEKNKFPIVTSILGAIAGIIGGAIIGLIFMVVYISITDSAFGFDNIWPATLAGALIGMLLGILFPKIGGAILSISTNFPP
jgi:uncharacterized membrane protein